MMSLILFTIFTFSLFASNEFDVGPKIFTQDGIQIVIADDDLHGFSPGNYTLTDDVRLRDKPTVNDKTGSEICGEFDEGMKIQVIKVLRVFETDEVETKKRIRGQVYDGRWLTLYDIGNDIEFINSPEEKRKRKQNQDKEKYAAVLRAVYKADKEILSSLLNDFSEDEKQKLTEYLITEDKNTDEKNTVFYFAIRHGYMLNRFGKEEKDTLIVDEEYKNDLIAYVAQEDEWKFTFLHYASSLGQEQNVKLLLNVFGQEKKDQLIEHLCKGNKYEQTALHLVSRNNHATEIIKMLFNAFGTSKDENKKRIDYLMQENDKMETALHLASDYGHEKNVKLLLDVFDKEQKEKLFEYLWKQNKYYKETALHIASKQGYEKIVKLLLDVFVEEEPEKLIDYVMKENKDKETSLDLASRKRFTLDFASQKIYQNIAKLLFQKVTDANKKQILLDLQKVGQMFKNQNKNKMKKSLLSIICDDDSCYPRAQEKILSFLITDYDPERYIIQEI